MDGTTVHDVILVRDAVDDQLVDGIEGLRQEVVVGCRHVAQGSGMRSEVIFATKMLDYRKHIAVVVRGQLRTKAQTLVLGVRGVIAQQKVLQVLGRDEDVREPSEFLLGVLHHLQLGCHGLNLLGQHHADGVEFVEAITQPGTVVD